MFCFVSAASKLDGVFGSDPAPPDMKDGSNRSGGDIISGALNSALQRLLVPALLSLLVATGVAQSRELTDPNNWPAWLVLLCLFVAFTYGWQPLRRSIARWRVPVASGQRIGLLLACLDGDKADNSLRETVREAVKKDLGEAIEIILWPETLRLADGRDADAENRARGHAQKWLVLKRCDLLLWGRVKGDKTLSLRFTPASGDTAAAESYALTPDTLELPVKFVSNLGSAIAARVVSDMDAETSGQDRVALMRSSAERMEPIIKTLSPAFEAKTRGSLFHSYGLVRFRIGDEAGTKDDLIAAIDAYRDALKEWTRERVPQDWAMAQNNLGNALRGLAEHESSTVRLEDAVAAFRGALEVASRENTPLLWMGARINLGIALWRLGKRTADTAHIEAAVAVTREALEEATRESYPFVWAALHDNLGNMLQMIGEVANDRERLEEAVVAHRNALEQWTRESNPSAWAAVQNHLGISLAMLGERETGAARLEEAVIAFQNALTERTRERNPLTWAETQANLGNSLAALGERESGTTRLEQAVIAFRSALTERTRERDPLGWATTRGDLGSALVALGARESGTVRLEQAVAAEREALTVLERAGAPEVIERYRSYLERAETMLAERRKAKNQ
jgi:tetratricopeptide (TPR) repeat protein